MAQRFGEAFAALTAFRGVSIAAVNGYAMGGGLECAMACDIRIAEEHAQMALPEASVGLLPCAGGTQNLPWLVGEGWAKRMILCGERVTAAKALEIGLVEEVVPTGNGLEAALKLAEGACKQSPSSIARCKQLVMSARDGRSHSDGWRMERLDATVRAILRVAGYELLFRNGQVEGAHFLNGDQATSEVITSSVVDIGLNNLVGTHPAFINATQSFLNGDLPLPELKGQIVKWKIVSFFLFFLSQGVMWSQRSQTGRCA